MLVAPNVRTNAAIISFVPLIHRSCIVCLPTARSRCGEFRCPILNGHTAGRSLLIHHEKIGRCVGARSAWGRRFGVANIICGRSMAARWRYLLRVVPLRFISIGPTFALNSLPLTALGFATEWRQIMTLRKALLAAAVLVLSVPVVPALANDDDDDNGYSSHDRYHDKLYDQHELAHRLRFKTVA